MATSTEDIEMREPARVQATKRKNVDEHNQEVPELKRSKASPNNSVKMNATKLILHWHEYLIRCFGVTERSMIDTVAKITSHVETIHTKFRQDMNRKGNIAALITDSYEFAVDEVKTTFAQIKGPMKELAAAYGFKYDGTEEDKKRLGTLSALLVLHVAYKHRYNEVRIGNNKITVGKDNQKNILEMEIARFGLSSAHQILLSGCTYTPMVASSMKQSLGPMTIAIHLAQTKEEIYQKSWIDAFLQAFKLFPMAAEIANILKGSGTKEATLIRLLADIALFGTTRTSNKAYFPIAMLLVHCFQNATYKAHFGATGFNMTALADEAIPDAIKKLDRSGHGALNFWNQCRNYDFTIKKGKDMKAVVARETVFHAVWGTHKEDLGLLKWMTSHSFLTRKKIGNQYMGRGSGAEMSSFKMIPIKKFAKLANASQTDFLEGGTGQVCRMPTFSGKCTYRVDLNGELMKFLKESAQESFYVSGSTKERIIIKLQDVKKMIDSKVRPVSAIDYGTTVWKTPATTDNGDVYGPDVVEAPELTGEFFYSNN